MIAVTLSVFVIVFGLALWLGLYLIGRDPQSPRLLLTGLGLLAYALAVAGNLLASVASADLTPVIQRLSWPLLMLPALFWTGALIYLLPEETPARQYLTKLWKAAVFPAMIGLISVSLFARASQGIGVIQVSAGVVLLLSMLALGGFVWQTLRERRRSQVVGVLVVFTLFFALSTALFLLPHDWLPRVWTLLAIGTDVMALGLVIAYFDAFEEGEALLPDMVRSFDATLLFALVFGGPVGVVIWLSTGVTLAMLSLLLLTVATAVATSTLADRISVALDRVALGRMPRLRQARSELQATARSLQRRHPTLDPSMLEEYEFARITRRALSNFGDLPRLSASPLINLALIDHRLPTQSASDNPLERAVELKTVLAESISRLKPRTGADFGTSDEWRYYNALYFPYVAGIKAYSSRPRTLPKDPTVREALEWFRAAVPERTLYNWQNVAAKLVARDLLTRNEAVIR